MSRCAVPPVIGLIGGIGSGKSTVAREYADRFAALVLDGDRTGHDVLNREDVREQIRQRFGAEVFDTDGRVSRSKLAREVFGEEQHLQQARSDLEQILHPAIRKRFDTQIEEARSAGSCEAVLLDAAVLLEAGWQDRCDAVVFVDTPADVRRRRILTERGWSEDELYRREASQLPLEEKRRRSDYRIDNSQSLAEAVRQLKEYIDATIARCAGQDCHSSPEDLSTAEGRSTAEDSKPPAAE